MTMHLQHAFTTTSTFYEDKDKQTVHGSSTYKASDDKLKKKVKTCVKKAGQTSGCVRTFEPGEDIVYSIKEWLDLAGLSLDDITTRIESPLDGKHPTNRLSGVKIHVKITYTGLQDAETWDADLTVSAKQGWNSIGSASRWIDYKSESDKEFFDDYSYGVSFDFFPSGQAVRFDWTITFNTIIASLVLISTSTMITSLVAFYLVPEKAVYQNAVIQTLEYDNTVAKFAVTTALACQAFKEWDKHPGDGAPHIDCKELQQVFRPAFDEETASQLSNVIMKMAETEGKPGELYCDKLVNLMGKGLVAMPELRAHAQKMHGQGSGKVVPAQSEDA